VDGCASHRRACISWREVLLAERDSSAGGRFSSESESRLPMGTPPPGGRFSHRGDASAGGTLPSGSESHLPMATPPRGRLFFSPKGTDVLEGHSRRGANDICRWELHLQEGCFLTEGDSSAGGTLPSGNECHLSMGTRFQEGCSLTEGDASAGGRFSSESESRLPMGTPPPGGRFSSPRGRICWRDTPLGERVSSAMGASPPGGNGHSRERKSSSRDESPRFREGAWVSRAR
jgi:hypothetical protein